MVHIDVDGRCCPSMFGFLAKHTEQHHPLSGRDHQRRNVNHSARNPLVLTTATPRPAGLLDHQCTDRCSERESPTRPRSSPLRLDPHASPDGAPRLRLHLAHIAAHLYTSEPHLTLHAPTTATNIVRDPLPGAKILIEEASSVYADLYIILVRRTEPIG
jgi:hypothetical protein